MQITVSGRLVSIDPTNQTAQLAYWRRHVTGPKEDFLALTFSSDLAFRMFARRKLGENLVIIGEVYQLLEPYQLGNAKKSLAVLVKEHRKLLGVAYEPESDEPVESDILVVSGIVSLRGEAVCDYSPAGLPRWRGLVAASTPAVNPRGPQPSDFYNGVAYGQLVDRMRSYTKGTQFLVEWGAVQQDEFDDRPQLIIRDLRAIPQAYALTP